MPAVTQTDRQTHTLTPSTYSPVPHPSHLIYTPLHTLILVLTGTGPGTHGLSSTIFHLLISPAYVPMAPTPSFMPFSRGHTCPPHPTWYKPKWLILSGCLARPRHCLHLKSLPQLHSQPGSGRHISLHLRALGDILWGCRPPGTQHCPLLGNPCIGFSSPGQQGLEAPEESRLLTVGSRCLLKGHRDPFQGGWPELGETATEPISKVEIKGRGCSSKLSKDYTGISWAFNSCGTGQRTGPVVLTLPTPALRLTGVRSSSATTADTPAT